ncbi:hypothetical protein EOD43_19320 [Sphingomonas crocodyli]|jgi:hypothetical protein|uniref:Uncharacterized protein n=1 Tax=Sphingomonas crocodyli TaxID=1979270 RepID=A0A437LYF9_9SPHN|nr:hypothetical protein EOD43_19320 [Sphingomonas crocodyli]
MSLKVCIAHQLRLLEQQSGDIGFTFISHSMKDGGGFLIGGRAREASALLHPAPHFSDEFVALHDSPLRLDTEMISAP